MKTPTLKAMYRDHKRTITFIGIGLIVLALLFGISSIARKDQVNRSADFTATQQYERSKQVAPLTLTAQSEIKDHVVFRDEWRSERDLRAQQDMAFWAQALFWVTFLGLGLLGATLWETRRAGLAAARMVDEAKKQTQATQDNVTETRRVGEAQVRAYLTVQKVSASFDRQPVLTCKIRNGGASPALQIEVEVAFAYSFTTIPEVSDSGSTSVQIGTIQRDDRAEDEV